MVTTAHNYSNESRTASVPRFGIWISRLPLVIATIIFTGISSKFLLDPVGTAAQNGVSFNSGAGITLCRIGFGAFPLAFAIITFSCLIARRRVLAGIYIVSTVIGVVLVVRVVAMLVDNSVASNARLLAPEIVLLALSYIGANMELRRRRLQAEAQPAS
jgi:hypothetical protein